MTAPPSLDDIPPALAFLVGGGAATRLILARDWTGHPLGSPADWPVELKAALSLVLNSPESMILCWGAEPLFFFFNETYFPLLGPRLDWAMGARFDEVWADALEQARPIIADAFAGDSRHFDDLPWKLDTDRGAADTWFSFSYSRVLDRNGEIAGLFIFTNETTARVLADRALVESQAQLADLNASLERQVTERTAERDRMWNASPDLMVVLSPDGIYRDTNPAWFTVLGYTREETIGLGPTDLAHPDDVAATWEALAAAQEDALPSFEHRVRHRDGSYRCIQWVAAPGPQEIFAIGRNVTAAREAEMRLAEANAQLAQAQKMEAIGQLTGGVAHDFNNLLTIISGSAELLKRPGLSDERRARYVEAIGDTAARAAKLTGQLLAFARRQALSPEPVDLGPAVAAVGDMVRTLVGAQVAVAIELPDAPCIAEVDRNQFETAIVNMAANARDAMPGGGRLTIGVAPPSATALRSAPDQGIDYVAVTVADDGAGIEAEDLQRIFEPFFTTKDVGKGTGLGLSQVIGFARQSGGDVAVESIPGRGTTFSLLLPRRAGGPIAAHRADRPADPAVAGLRVLLVEDNAEVGRFAADALDALGCRSTHAIGGAEALAALARDAGGYDVLFSDVVMPGMDGVSLARAVRAAHPRLPVVLASGYSHALAEDAQHGFELLHKPYSVAQLARALAQAVHRHAAAS